MRLCNLFAKLVDGKDELFLKTEVIVYYGAGVNGRKNSCCFPGND